MAAKRSVTRKQATTNTNSKKVQTKGSLFSKRFIVPSLFVAVFAIIGGVLLLSSSKAASYAHWCSFEFVETCADNYAGVIQTGNPIFASGYESTNYHEYFTKRVLTGACNNGRVTSTCPFAVGLGLNNRYLNDEIVAFQYGSFSECLGTNSSKSAVLQPCGSLYSGIGAGVGTMFVWNSGGAGSYGFTESVYWSNKNDAYNTPFWLCHSSPSYLIVTKYQPKIGASTSGQTCQWEPST